MKTKIKSQDIQEALDKVVEAKREQYGSYEYPVGFLLQLVVHLSDNLSEKSKEILLEELKGMV